MDNNTARQRILIKLMNKVLVCIFINNFSREMSRRCIPSAELSREAGKAGNAFSKTINQGEDPQLSSFLRYWHAASSSSKDKQGRDFPELDFNKLICSEAVNVLLLIRSLSNCDINNLSSEDSKTILNVKFYVDLLTSKKALTEIESNVYKEIYIMLDSGGNQNEA